MIGDARKNTDDLTEFGGTSAMDAAAPAGPDAGQRGGVLGVAQSLIADPISALADVISDSVVAAGEAISGGVKDFRSGFAGQYTGAEARRMGVPEAENMTPEQLQVFLSLPQRQLQQQNLKEQIETAPFRREELKAKAELERARAQREDAGAGAMRDMAAKDPELAALVQTFGNFLKSDLALFDPEVKARTMDTMQKIMERLKIREKPGKGGAGGGTTARNGDSGLPPLPEGVDANKPPNPGERLVYDKKRKQYGWTVNVSKDQVVVNGGKQRK